jgi:hypothetical protein
MKKNEDKKKIPLIRNKNKNNTCKNQKISLI